MRLGLALLVALAVVLVACGVRARKENMTDYVAINSSVVKIDEVDNPPGRVVSPDGGPWGMNFYPDEGILQGYCVQGCPMDSADCQRNYFMCVNTCGPDLTDRSSPPCLERCKAQAAACRQRFLNCANGCGGLYIS